MAFFRPVLEHHKAMSAKVSVSIRKAASQKVHQLKLRIGEMPLQALRLSKGDRIEVLWGSGSDAGRILIQRAQGKAGGFLRHCGRSTSPTLEVNLGNLPRLPIASDDRKRWTLRMENHAPVRLDWEPYPRTGPVQGLQVTLPQSWWLIEDGAGAFRAYSGRAA